MAITSSRVPRKLRKSDRTLGVGSMSIHAGDSRFERANGLSGRLSEVTAQPVTGISSTTRDDLFRQAGIKIQRGITG